MISVITSLETIKFSCWGEFRPTQNWRVISEDREGSNYFKMSSFFLLEQNKHIADNTENYKEQSKYT